MHGSQIKFHIMKRSMSRFSKFSYLKNFLACTPASSNISNVWKLVAKKNVKPGGCQVKLHTVKALHLDSKKLQKKNNLVFQMKSLTQEEFPSVHFLRIIFGINFVTFPITTFFS